MGEMWHLALLEDLLLERDQLPLRRAQRRLLRLVQLLHLRGLRVRARVRVRVRVRARGGASGGARGRAKGSDRGKAR